MLKEWGNGQAPAREAAKAGDMKTGIPLFVNAIGGPGALTVVPMPTRGWTSITQRPIRPTRRRSAQDRSSPATWRSRPRMLSRFKTRRPG